MMMMIIVFFNGDFHEVDLFFLTGWTWLKCSK